MRKTYEVRAVSLELIDGDRCDVRLEAGKFSGVGGLWCKLRVPAAGHGLGLGVKYDLEIRLKPAGEDTPTTQEG